VQLKVKKVIIVGLGSIGKRHIKNINQVFPKIKVILFRHKNCDEASIDKLVIDSCFTNIDEAIDTGAEAAIIANPAPMHIAIAKKLAQSGISILIEKPISNSLYGVQELIDICDNNQIMLMTGYNLRFKLSLIEFKRQLDKKKIGKIYSVNAQVGQYLPDWRPNSDYVNSVSASKELGGGVLLELSHEIDYLAWIFGPITWVKSHLSKQSNLDIDVEDSANIILGISNNNNSEIIVNLNMDFIRHNRTRTCLVIGDKGSLIWDGVTGEVREFMKGCDQWKTFFSDDKNSDYSYVEEVKSFFSSLENDMEPHITGEDGLQVLKVIDAIKMSNQIGAVKYLSI
jgi:predicted dehydrogenase